MDKKTDLQKATIQKLEGLKHEYKMIYQVEAKHAKQLNVQDQQNDKLIKEVKLATDTIKEKDKIIKKLKESLEANKPNEIEIVQETINMNNPSVGHKCNACNKISGKIKTLKAHGCKA